MRFGLMIEGQEGIGWAQWRRLADACERVGLEGLFTSDHYLSVIGEPGRGSFDAWTVLAGLAATTSTLRLGTLVSPVTFRHPAVLAKVATTVDHISGGRVEIGLGAGWWADEHRAHGFPFPRDADRMAMLEEQLEIVHRLLSADDDEVSFHGRFYRLERCAFVHRPVQRPRPPIIVGGKGGPRLARLVARWADEFNTVGGTPREVRQRFARVREAVDAVGRDQSTVTTSLMTWCYVGADERELDARLRAAHALDPSAGPFEGWLADLSRDCIVGTPDRAAERLAEYAEAGAQRIFLNHELFDDLATVELLAEEILPRVA
ncbi:MAG TPA: TIGR03560 family F420-dependent LLM class oxidoreductase [Actinomycetota bacterium]|nr:TIGR03560 family F420-dependent LLM class oxidoreductase [Actinomycetota bacterium]